jgi:hypothetical protein
MRYVILILLHPFYKDIKKTKTILLKLHLEKQKHYKKALDFVATTPIMKQIQEEERNRSCS